MLDASWCHLSSTVCTVHAFVRICSSEDRQHTYLVVLHDKRMQWLTCTRQYLYYLYFYANIFKISYAHISCKRHLIDFYIDRLSVVSSSRHFIEHIPMQGMSRSPQPLQFVAELARLSVAWEWHKVKGRTSENHLSISFPDLCYSLLGWTWMKRLPYSRPFFIWPFLAMQQS